MELTSVVSIKYKNPSDVHKLNYKWQNGNICKYLFSRDQEFSTTVG